MDDTRIQYITAADGVGSKLDLGAYRHTRLQIQSDGGMLVFALDQSSAQNPTGASAYLASGGDSAAGTVSPVLNLDGLSGVFWVAGFSAAVVFTVIQWGCYHSE
jgi:hypothetical protein